MNQHIRILRNAVCLAGTLATASACANVGDSREDVATTRPDQEHRNQAVTDLWIDTRLETAYLFNGHLNNFRIQTDVDNGAVLLTGTVSSEIDKDLAGEIARSLEDVRSVDNQLVVRESLAATSKTEQNDFVRKVDDATTTARVKTRLIGNEHLSGLQIDVDTEDAVVTLAGDVASDQERQLAGLIARNTPDVRSVRNQLQIAESDRS